MASSDSEQVLSVLPEEDVTPSFEETSADDSACNSFSLNLRTSALSVQMQTTTAHSAVLTELNIRLEFAEKQARSAEERLMNAIYRIGYLESQLCERDKEIAALRSKT